MRHSFLLPLRLLTSLLLLCFVGKSVANDVVLPYKDINGKLVIKATLGGKERSFVFDTGAPLYITSSLAAELQAETLGKQAITDASNKSMTLEKVSVSGLTLGNGLTIDEAKAIVVPKGNMVEQFGVDGMIGCDILGGKTVRIDSRQSTITISDSSAPYAISPRCLLSMQPNGQNIPVVTLNIGGETVMAMFDSGSSSFLELSGQDATSIANADGTTLLAQGYGSQGIGMGGQGEKETMERIKISDLRIATGKFRNVVATSANVPLTRIGSKLLSHGIVTLDYAANSFFFEPFVSTPVDVYEKAFNLDFTVNNGYVCVSCVWEKTLLDSVAVGDRVISVDGKAIGKVDVSSAIKGSILDVKGDSADIEIVNSKGVKTAVKLIRK